MGKIKIAFFVDVLQEGFDGVAHTNHKIIENIPHDDFETVYVTPYPPLNKIKPKVINSPYVIWPLQKKYRFALPKFSLSLKKKLDEFSPDIIHFSSPSALGKYAIKYAKSKNKPVTTIYHTHFPSYFEYYIKKFKPLKFIERFSLSIFHRENILHTCIQSDI